VSRLAVLLLAFMIASVTPLSAQAPAAQQHTASASSRELAEAEAFIAKSDWKGAEVKLAAWISGHPTDGRALFDAGYVADAQNRLDAAADFYRRALNADPKSFEAHLSLGLLLARLGKLEEARPELTAATHLDTGNADPALKARAWRALARIDRATNPTEASNDLLQALKLTQETPEDTLLAAELAESSGELDAAEAAYRRLLARDPKTEAANAGLAHVLIARKQYPDAETLLRTALQQSPDDPTLTAQLATVLVAEDKAEALPLLQKLHDAHPQDAVMTRMLAEVMAEAGDVAGSDQLYAKLLAAHPGDADLLVAHGQNLIRQQKFEESFQVFDKASQLAPANGDAWSGLAFAASKTARPSITLHALAMRSRYLPENPSSYFLWATSYDNLHDRAAAIAYYHHFLEAAAGKFPDQEWQARQRLLLLEKK
jgi:predicted Zn-dependent protease